MKKVTRNTCVLMLIVVMILASVCGCTEKADSNATDKSNDAQNTTEAGGSNNSADAGEPVTIRFMTQDHSNYPMNADAPVFQELMARTNINIVFETTPSANYVDKRNIVIATGELPDLMFITGKDAVTNGQKGTFAPLNELISGSDYLKDLLTPEIIIDGMGLDGNVYAIPMINDIPNMATTLLVRQDWVDMLGLDAPETMDDFYEMLVAFRDEIPALIDADSVYPLVCCSSGSTSALTLMIDTLSYAYDTRKEWNVVDGKCVYTPVTDEYKALLMFISKLYSDGLLDEEYVTLSPVQWEEKMSAGMSGSALYWVARADSVTPKLQQVVPDGEIVLMATPKGPSGSQGVRAIKTNPNNCLAISAKSLYINECFGLVDYMYGPEGTLLLNYGIEGLTYDMQNGTPVFKQEILDEISKAATVYNGASKYGMGMTGQAYNRMYQSLLDLGVYGPQVKKSISSLDGLAYMDYPGLKYTNEQQEKARDILASLNPVKEEYENKFVMGLLSFDQWDEYVQELENLGYKDYEEILNEAYIETQNLMNSLN